MLQFLKKNKFGKRLCGEEEILFLVHVFSPGLFLVFNQFGSKTFLLPFYHPSVSVDSFC
jgi:hypothetical protein